MSILSSTQSGKAGIIEKLKNNKITKDSPETKDFFIASGYKKVQSEKQNINFDTYQKVIGSSLFEVLVGDKLNYIKIECLISKKSKVEEENKFLGLKYQIFSFGDISKYEMKIIKDLTDRLETHNYSLDDFKNCYKLIYSM